MLSLRVCLEQQTDDGKKPQGIESFLKTVFPLFGFFGREERKCQFGGPNA